MFFSFLFFIHTVASSMSSLHDNYWSGRGARNHQKLKAWSPYCTAKWIVFASSAFGKRVTWYSHRLYQRKEEAPVICLGALSSTMGKDQAEDLKLSIMPVDETDPFWHIFGQGTHAGPRSRVVGKAWVPKLHPTSVLEQRRKRRKRRGESSWNGSSGNSGLEGHKKKDQSDEKNLMAIWNDALNTDE